MKAMELRIRPAAAPAGPAVAWLIPGDDAAAWLAELCRWGAPLAHGKLLLVPRSKVDRALLGALAFGLDPAAPPAPRCQPYACFAGRVFVPCDSAFDPPATPADLTRLFDDENLYVFHPVTGLVRFDPQDVVAPCDLLSLPKPSDESWDRARPGEYFPEELVRLLVELPLPLEEYLEQGGDGIGEKSRDLDELPRGPHEPSSILGRMKEGAADSLKRAASGIAARIAAIGASGSRDATPLPGRSPSETQWFGWLAKWLEGLSKRGIPAQRRETVDERRRRRELERLLRVLNTDPDAGLKFALPLAGDAFRGLSAPGNTLVPRSTEFNLASLGGSGSADPWRVAEETRRLLAARYRELAQREQRLGRYRRAAYIFAKLLGDFSAAAAALFEGRHYREAAVLYRDRVGDRRREAECLELGGQFDEAIALYEDMTQYFRCGEISDKLGRSDRAREYYRKEVDRRLAYHETCSAAQLLVDRLEAWDEALAHLQAAWEAPGRGAKCLEMSFDLWGRSGRHEAALQHAVALVADAATFDEPKTWRRLSGLSHAAAEYPLPAVRAAAADGVRALVGTALPKATPFAGEQLVALLAPLAPQDLLLARDADRYRDRIRPPAPQVRPQAALKGPASARPVAPRLVHEFQLPGNLKWATAVSCRDFFYAAGIRVIDGLQAVSFAGGTWDGTCELASQSFPLQWPAHRLKLMMRGTSDMSNCIVAGTAWPTGDEIRFEKRGSSHFHSIRPLPAAWHNAICIDQSSNLSFWMIDRQVDGDVLAAYDHANRRLHESAVPYTDSGERQLIEPEIVARNGMTFIAEGRDFLSYSWQHKTWLREQLDKPVSRLMATAPGTKVRLALSFDFGAEIRWRPFIQGARTRFAESLERPRICFLPSGHVVAASRQECEVYRIANQTLRDATPVATPDGPLVAVLPADPSNRFALVGESGTVRVYEV